MYQGVFIYGIAKNLNSYTSNVKYKKFTNFDVVNSIRV